MLQKNNTSSAIESPFQPYAPKGEVVRLRMDAETSLNAGGPEASAKKQAARYARPERIIHIRKPQQTSAVEW